VPGHLSTLWSLRNRMSWLLQAVEVSLAAGAGTGAGVSVNALESQEQNELALAMEVSLADVPVSDAGAARGGKSRVSWLPSDSVL
jgi:hypothetical protein